MKYVICALVCLCGCSKPKDTKTKKTKKDNSVITAREIKIVDAKGKVRVRIGDVKGQFGVRIYGKNGMQALSIEESQGYGVAGLSDDNGNQRLLMTGGAEKKVFLGFYDPPKGKERIGNPRLTFGVRPYGFSGIQVWDNRGREKATLFHNPKKGVTSLVYSKGKLPSALLSASDKSGSMLLLTGKDGRVKFLAPKSRR